MIGCTQGIYLGITFIGQILAFYVSDRGHVLKFLHRREVFKRPWGKLHGISLHHTRVLRDGVILSETDERVKTVV